jgi:NAD(P)-dependent dehydrogenase (short-subunit alcohol dehydrogenase family)
MRILILGAAGTIGAALAERLAGRHEILAASRSGSLAVDLTDPESVQRLFERVKDLDAVVCCAAGVPLAPLETLAPEKLRRDLSAKVFGQIEVTRRAVSSLRDSGSITLTGGTFVAPLAHSAAGALANRGLEAFVASAAPEMPRGIRLNVIAPGWIAETLKHLGMDPAEGTPVSTVAAAYVDAIEGSHTGRTIRPGISGG